MGVAQKNECMQTHVVTALKEQRLRAGKRVLKFRNEGS